MDWFIIVLSLAGLGIGLGLRFFRFIPDILLKILGITATVGIAVMFWNILGLPSVEMLDMLLSWDWVMGLTVGYLLGDRVGDLWS